VTAPGQGSRTIRVHLADAPTDVLAHLAAHPSQEFTVTEVVAAVAPADAHDARTTVASALQTLWDLAYARIGSIPGTWRVTVLGIQAVREATESAEAGLDAYCDEHKALLRSCHYYGRTHVIPNPAGNDDKGYGHAPYALARARAYDAGKAAAPDARCPSVPAGVCGGPVVGARTSVRRPGGTTVSEQRADEFPACGEGSGATERLVESVHHLKTWPDLYAEVDSGRKTCDVRKDDRGFDVGHTLVLQEWDPATEAYTGRWTIRLVTHVLRGWGIEDGYVAMSITDRLTALDTPESAEEVQRG
jgi:hypothetical protein